MSNNDATIDLKANTSKLNEGLAKGLDETQKFAAEATQSFEAVGHSSEELTKHVQSVADELSKLIEETNKTVSVQGVLTSATAEETSAFTTLLGVVKEQIISLGVMAGVSKTYASATTQGAAINNVATASYTAMGASIVKTTASLAASLAMTIKLNLAVIAATAVVKGFSLVADKTGSSITVLDKSLVLTQKILDETRGNVGKLATRLEEMGITAEEAGIKVENNLSKIQEAFGKLARQLTKGTDEPLAKASSAWNHFWATLKENGDKEVTAFSKQMISIVDAATNAAKELSAIAKRQAMLANGATEDEVRAEVALQANLEKTAKESKVREVKERFYADELAAFKEHLGKIATLEQQREDEERIFAEKSYKNIGVLIEAHRQERVALGEAGLFHDQIADAWLVKDAMLIARQNDLQKAIKETQKRLTEDLGAKGSDRRQKEIDDEKLLNAMAVANHGQLIDMLDEEKETRARLAQLQQDDVEKYAEAVARNDQRVAELERAIHDRKLSDIATENARREDGINRQIEQTKQLSELHQDFNDAQDEMRQERTLRTLEIQGATEKQLHEQRLKFIAEEEQKQLARLKLQDPVEIARIQLEATKRVQLEQADFDAKQVEDKRQIALVRRDEARRTQDEKLLKDKASEYEIHNVIMKRLQEEQAEETRGAQTEAARLRVRLEFERRLNEERQRFKKEQDAQGKGATGKPLTFKERRDQMRAAIMEQKQAVEKAKEDRNKKRADKLAEQRKKNIARQKRDAANPRLPQRPNNGADSLLFSMQNAAANKERTDQERANRAEQMKKEIENNKEKAEQLRETALNKMRIDVEFARKRDEAKATQLQEKMLKAMEKSAEANVLILKAIPDIGKLK